MIDLTLLSVAELLELRSNITEKLDDHRLRLEMQLAILNGKAISRRKYGPKGHKVLPKYRHPETGQEWSGRGVTPRWLAAEVAAGKLKDSFLIK